MIIKIFHFPKIEKIDLFFSYFFSNYICYYYHSILSFAMSSRRCATASLRATLEAKKRDIQTEGVCAQIMELGVAVFHEDLQEAFSKYRNTEIAQNIYTALSSYYDTIRNRPTKVNLTGIFKLITDLRDISGVGQNEFLSVGLFALGSMHNAIKKQGLFMTMKEFAVFDYFLFKLDVICQGDYQYKGESQRQLYHMMVRDKEEKAGRDNVQRINAIMRA
jgi:hypothetical protein